MCDEIGKVQFESKETAPMDSPESVTLKPPLSYAASVLSPISRFSTAMMEDFVLGEDDYTITDGKLGPNIRFSQRVEDKLDLDWNCAVIVKLMGRPNTENAYDFMKRALTRKWTMKGPWQLIDLPNSFFIVKFQLVEDMNYALCNGPWIIAGQTLVVQKWRPEFDPYADKITHMAVWVRINGLPVKYFKQFTMERIGSMIGKVVKVDQHTLAQARGKFCRVCVEINLAEPLKPFVEMDSRPFSVVYEGISTICFNCGVYGHVKEHCPYVGEVANAEEVSEAVNNKGSSPLFGVNSVTKTDTSIPIPENVPQASPHISPSTTKCAVKSNMGPWMIMNYRKKKSMSNAQSEDVKEKNSSGSRFAPLQAENGIEGEKLECNAHDVAPKTHTDKLSASEPKIVKIWKQVQEKTEKSLPKEGKMKEKAVVKNPEHSDAMPNPMRGRTPLQEISNAKPAPSKTRLGSKTRSAFGKGTKDNFPSSSKSLASSSVMQGVFKTGFTEFSNMLKAGQYRNQSLSSTDAEFGHTPPEEDLNQEDVDGDCVLVNIGDEDHQSPNDSSTSLQASAIDDAGMQSNLSSQKGEDMIVS
ncbi:uncharacterized protein LOC133737531 [Rosa rugosa]|uniref:uncharacterized protein LOC133737531 n=1 Tax=Rosa rugosa TaxID=74645 RepID=UPI002B410653|nr:uncharacterized protein LOC133737531 [Rosa rugosa]